MRDFAFVPVIDVMDGVAVQARAGARQHYRPLETPLASSCDPVDVACGLAAASGAETLYVADLDAIVGKPPQDAVMARLQAAHPGIEFWVDRGCAATAAGLHWLRASAGTLVLGSESLPSAAPLQDLKASEFSGRLALSLDFDEEGFLGPADLLDRPELWPPRVIVMTLARVGTGRGPDWARLAEIRARAGGRAVYAAGGVRTMEDARRLHAMGLAGALIASAFHHRHITRDAIAAFRGRRR